MTQQEPTPAGAFVCGKCSAPFETQEELDRHVEAEHAEGEEEEHPAD